MKVCPKCKKSYPDTLSFCSDCGVQLTKDSSSSGSTRAPEIVHKPTQYPGWLCIVIALAGVFVGWEWSALFGFVLGFIGATLGSKTENTFMKWASYVLCGITVLFLVLVAIFD